MTDFDVIAIILHVVASERDSAILENDTAKRDTAIINSQISERETPSLGGKRKRFGERGGEAWDTDKGLNIRV